jgi:hypothetical protein
MELEMNERIEKLAEQAEKYADDNFKGEPFWTQAYESKFAELIVRDCMLICEDVMKKDNSALGCWIEIKRKFRS